jgi:hypothetical protein
MAWGHGQQNQGGCKALKIDAMHWTGLAIAGSWFLTVEPGGHASIRTDAGERPLQLPEDVCEGLVKIVKEERFFELAGEYGDGVIDGPMRKLDISLGGKSHSVRFYDDALTDKTERRAVKRVVRVWVAVRDLFEFPNAVDSRKTDRAFLEH